MSSVNARNTYPRLVPESLDPLRSIAMFPTLERSDMLRIRAAGWMRVGIVAAVLDEQKRMLMLSHNASTKTPAGALGPLAETLQAAPGRQGHLAVEPISDTLSRGIKEELAIESPISLRARARRVGAWALNSWPVGINHEGQYALAVCPVVHLDRDGREKLLDTFKPTEEISAVQFMPLEEVAATSNVRPGTHAWLVDVAASGLMNPTPQDLEFVAFNAPPVAIGAQDVVFDRMNI